MSTLMKQLPDGRLVPVDDERRTVVPDGQRVRVPLVMMDGKTGMSDEDAARKAAARQGYVNRLGDAWKSPPPQRQPQIGDERQRAPVPVQQVGDASESEAYRRYKARLEDGWRR